MSITDYKLFYSLCHIKIGRIATKTWFGIAMKKMLRPVFAATTHNRKAEWAACRYPEPKELTQDIPWKSKSHVENI